MSETRRLEKVIFFILFLEVAPPLPPRLLTHEHVQTSMLKRWRSWLPVLYNSIYLKQGGGVFRLGKQAEEISNSSVACSCIIKVHSCPQAIFVLFLVKTCGGGAEEWCRTLYLQLFAQTCKMNDYLIDAVPSFKTMFNSGDQLVYLPSYRLQVQLLIVEKAAEPKSFLTATCAKRILGRSNKLHTARCGEPSNPFRAVCICWNEANKIGAPGS